MKIPLAQFVEWFAARQRAHYAEILEKSARRVAEMGIYDDETERALYEEQKRFLDADFERCVTEASKLVASGMRPPDEPVH
jgi:hypothetical protein